jgi:hypothetical protein
VKTLYITAYKYHDDLDADDLRELTTKFQEIGTVSNVVAHYTRLDGRGGFVVQEPGDDAEGDFEITIQYGPWIDFEVIPVTTIEEAFPVIQRVYG